MTRAIICGGRDFTDRDRGFAALDLIHAGRGLTFVIEGGARGADAIAFQWANSRCVHGWHMPADWATHGKAAGPIRNQDMLDRGKPDLVIAFPGGAGTADMVRRARAAGVEVLEVTP